MSETKTYSCWTKCSCGNVFEVTGELRGFLGIRKQVQWKINRCPACGKKVDDKELELVCCPHCGEKALLPNKEKREDRRCIKCGMRIGDGIKMPAIRVACSKCGLKNTVEWDGLGEPPKDKKCAFCQEPISPEAIRMAWVSRIDNANHVAIITLECPDDHVIFKHPVNEFSYKSQLNVREDTWVICLQNGECKEVWRPGSHTLTESTLDSAQRALESEEGDGTVFRTDIYCVKRFLKTFNFCVPLDASKGDRDYKGSVIGNIRLEVFDAKAFASAHSYADLKWETLIDMSSADGAKSTDPDTGGRVFPKPTDFYRVLRADIREAVIRNLGEDMDRFPGERRDKYDLLQPLRDKIGAIETELNKKLEAQGLRVQLLDIDDCNLEESDSSRVKELIHRGIIRYTQDTVCFGEGMDPVRVKDAVDDTMFIDFRFKGSCRLKVADEEEFFGLPEVRHFMTFQDDNEELKKAVGDCWKKEIERRLYSFYNCVLPQLVRETGTDIRWLPEVFGALSDSLKSYLNANLDQFGLNVIDVAMDKAGEEYSPALKSKKELAEAKSKDILDRELKRWQSEGRIEDLLIEQKETTARENIIGSQIAERNQNEAKNTKAAVAADLEKDDVLTQEEIHKYENEKKKYAASAGYSQFTHRTDTETEIGKAKDDAALNIAKRDIADEDEDHKAERIDDADYKKFERQDRLAKAIAQAKADLRVAENRAKYAEENEEQAHKLELDRNKFDFDWAKQIDEGKYKNELRGIMNKINDSGLDWQRKLDEYERLKILTGLKDIRDTERSFAELRSYTAGLEHQDDMRAKQDESDLRHKNEREEIDIRIAKLKAELGLSEEEKEFYQRMADMEENRRQRGLDADTARKQVEFEQRLQENREALAGRMEELKLRFDLQEKLWGVQSHDLEQQEETRRMALKLRAYEREVTEKYGAETCKAIADAAARSAEAKYKSEHEKDAAARAEQAEKERISSAEQYAKMSLEFQQKMAEINKEIEKYKFDYMTASDKARYESEGKSAEGRRQDEKDDLNRMDALYGKLLDWEKTIREMEIGRDKNRDTVYASSDNGRIDDRLDRIARDMERIRSKVEELRKNAKNGYCPPANGTPGNKNVGGAGFNGVQVDPRSLMPGFRNPGV